jgi:hypothetical protein
MELVKGDQQQISVANADDALTSKDALERERNYLSRL